MNNIVEYNPKQTRNHKDPVQPLSTGRDLEKPIPEAKSEQPKFSSFFKKWWWIFAIIAGVIIIVVIVIAVKFSKKDKDDPVTPVKEPEVILPPGIDIEETKKVFSPSFKINTKEKTLTQLSQKSSQTYSSTNNGQTSSDSFLNEALYDIYTINSTNSSNSEKIFYQTKYTTVITVKSLCSKVSSNPEEDNCQLERQLDLNVRDESNLRRNEENAEELIKKAILPICIVEHTDTNLIISLTCPETLSPNYKDDIKRAFSVIKPDSMRGFVYDENYTNTISEEKEDKVFITSFDYMCVDQIDDPQKKTLCNVTKNIITDKEGNLISSKISNSTKTVIEGNNSLSNSFIYEFKNIPKENSESFNEEVYKKNLETILSLTKPLMKKEIFIANMTEIGIDLMTEEEPKDSTVTRNLKEKESSTPGVQEENIFTKTIYNISMDLDLKNDIGLTEDKTTKASSIHNVNKENYTELSNNKIQTYLYDVINDFISLSKSGNKIANQLYEDLNEPLLNFMDIISSNIQNINDLLANKDLSEIFDSTLAINELNTLPYDFVIATNNLFVTISDLQDNLLYNINNARKKFEENISTFLSDSHNLLFKIFNNLTDLSDSLSTIDSKIVGIANYYLNNTDVSYYEIIQSAKKILDNYYINEKDLISPLVDKILERFYSNAVNSIEKYKSMLDNISERLNDGNLLIKLATTEQYQSSISNIYNSKIKVNEIIETIQKKFKESIKLQPNGYFETQQEIDQNSQSYGEKGEKALKTSYSLDNNEFIDKTFDSVMTSFRDKFIELLKYMDNSIKDKFPLEQNVLGTSLFNALFLKDIDDFFQTEKINMLNFINNENDEYLKSVNGLLNNFTNTEGKSLEQIISDLMNSMTDIYLDNLNSAYDDSLNTALKTIDEIIENTNKLGSQYLTNVKNANSFHITTGFKNKYNTYANSIQTIYNFVNKTLKINLSNKYKNVITNFRTLLQSIKSNSILEKYYKQLPSAERHLNSIKDLFEIFNRHISDNTFNIKFLPLINNFTAKATEKLNTISKNFKGIYDNLAKKDLNNILNDYDSKRVVDGGYHCWRTWYGKKKCRKNPDIIYYDGKNVKGTNNHLNLKQINFDEYMKNFDSKFNEIYPQFSININSYNSLLSNLDIQLENEAQKETFKEKNIYLENIANKVNSIIKEKLGKTLLNASYNYFKNKISHLLPTELNDITEQWKEAYDQLYNDINTNKDNFKSSVFELFYMANFYLQTYMQNISYGYGKSIVERLKNDFNYTNKYYYNIIISKLNKTFAYILNNIPNNEKPFDKIINMRTTEIKTSYEKVLNELKNSKNEILEKTKQEATLLVNQKNFFLTNDLITSHIKYFNTSLTEKLTNIFSAASQILKENPADLVAAKFYLENSINGKQIKENYEMVNKATFIDLQTDVYQQLIDDIWKIDRDELINNIINALKEFNETNNNNFKFEKEKYFQLFQNKLYEEFGTKENLIQNINSNYSKGINKCNENSAKKILDEILNSVINKVTTHLTNEASRLSNELTSYSNDFSVIKKRLNDYKTSIYEKFYSTITYVVNNFHEHIYEKYYKNYIEKGINEYAKHIQETNFGTANFLNMSINLDSIIDKEFTLLIEDYKNLTRNQIEFLFQKNIQLLDQLFSFSNMKSKINNEIDKIFNSTLLPELQKVGVHTPGNEGVSNYDLPQEKLTDINTFIEEKISETKNIIKEMEGEGYTINDIIPADFSAVDGNNIYDNITNMFHEFKVTYTSQEKKEFDKIVGEKALNNFKTLMNNFIPSFGIDFFDRVLKFNEIQKINILYDNLRYSLAETIIYYIGLATINNDIKLPVDIKLRLYNLNNLDSVVKTKNDLIISSLNGELDKYFEETKNYITTKFVNDMTLNEEFDLKFKADLKDMIKGIISGNIHNYENEYINMMKDNIKSPFIEEYKSVLTSATKDMKEFVEKRKIELKAELDTTFSLDSDSILADTQSKLNKTKTAVDDYNAHFTTFKISEEVINFLDNYGNDVLAPKYRQIKDLLDQKTAELVVNNLETLSNAFREDYSIETFQEEVKKININFTTYINQFKTILNRYGSIEDVYKQNLNKEMSNYRRLRLLDETDNTQKTTDVKLNITFNELKKSSSLIKDFVESLSLFADFEDNIENYIKEKNKQYSFSVYNIEKNKDQNNYYDLMIERLNELNTISSEYYPKAKEIYDLMKEQIIDNIIRLNELLNSCEKVTYKTINDKYKEIKEKCTKIEDIENSEKKEINIVPYQTNLTDNYFTVKTKIENYVIDNKFTLDFIYDEETKAPKIVGKVVNNIQPKNFDIDFYSSIGQGGKLGRTINVAFNGISSDSNIVFDSGLNKATIVTHFKFDEYSVKTQYYEEKTNTVIKHIAGMTIAIPGVTTRVDIDTPEEEKNDNIDPKNLVLTENYLY